MKTLLSVLLLTATAVSCQKEKLTSFDQIELQFQDLISSEKYMGISAAVVRDGDLLWSKGYGDANRETHLAVSNDFTPFMIASISKTITGVCAMKLAEAGQLNLDANINDYLPFDVINPNATSTPITCRQIMSHVSGIVDTHYDEISDQFYYYGSDPTLSLHDFCEGLLKNGGQFYNAATFSTEAPGSSYSYSNLASALLGYIVESVSGQDFNEYAKTAIFTPLNMKHTTFRLSQQDTAAMAMPYNGEDVPYGHYTFADYPNGGLFTTANDLSIFLRMIIQGGTFGSSTILSSASVAQMLDIHFPDVQGADVQGLNFYYQSVGKLKDMVGHSGGESGVNTEMFYNPETKVGAIIFLNKDFVKEKSQSADIDYLMEQMLRVGAL